MISIKQLLGVSRYRSCSATCSLAFMATKRMSTGRVTTEYAKKMPKNYDDMPNDILLSMAIMGDQKAREERVIREIMSVDDVPWYVVWIRLRLFTLTTFLMKGES